MISSTSSGVTIMVSQDLSSCFGIPKNLVSDNGPRFKNAEFGKILYYNGIAHIKMSPYYPCSNGLAEQAVWTVIAALKKVSEGTEAVSVTLQLSNYTISSRSISSHGNVWSSSLNMVRPDSGSCKPNF